MSPFSRKQQLLLVEAASRAPSVHNIQPARWRFGSGDQIFLFEDSCRQLTVTDPGGQDNRISLGAAFEGMSLALSRFGWSLSLRELAPAGQTGPSLRTGIHFVARATVEPAARPDPLADHIYRRQCFRGFFAAPAPYELQHLMELLRAAPDVIPVVERSSIAEIGALDDRYGYEVLSRPDAHRELYHWMRFSKGNSLWYRDGLNGDCMAMSGPLRIVAAVLFHPRVFSMLRAIRIAPLLTAQSAKTISASAVAILHAPSGKDAFLAGRRFYRLWLQICEAGFSMCPMSVLADAPACADYLRRKWGVPDQSRIVNVFRIGKAPRRKLAMSPRIPAEELLI
jgi:hypothetical protein